jgi:hypothetical protein
VILEKNNEDAADAAVDDGDCAVMYVGLQCWVAKNGLWEREAVATGSANTCWNVD